MAKKKKASTPKTKKKPMKKEKSEKSLSSQLGGVLSFRWLKRMIKSKFDSLDLLDRWILKRRLVALFL